MIELERAIFEILLIKLKAYKPLGNKDAKAHPERDFFKVKSLKILAPDYKSLKVVLSNISLAIHPNMTIFVD